MTFTIISRRWFDGVNGNTYHSVEVYADGDLLGAVPFEYGYDYSYEQTAMKIIKDKKPRVYLKACNEAGHLIYRAHMLERYSPHKVISSVSDVARKRDL
jgi:hypothetical protein